MKLETKLFHHFRFYADWQPAGQHGYSIQVCLQLPERTLALPKVYLNNLHTSHIRHLYIDDDIYNHLLDEDHRRPFGKCQGPCLDSAAVSIFEVILVELTNTICQFNQYNNKYRDGSAV